MCYFENSRYLIVHHELFTNTVTLEIFYTHRPRPRLRRYVAQPPHNLLESKAYENNEIVDDNEIDEDTQLAFRYALYDLTPDSWRIIANIDEKEYGLITKMTKSGIVRQYLDQALNHNNEAS